ncbi:MAG TPA: hypothetical protein VHG71_12210 [Verrucomicrobiae bacterium]|nr:hypothetical protein [Verrucomicrobiae bacterium]
MNVKILPIFITVIATIIGCGQSVKADETNMTFVSQLKSGASNTWQDVKQVSTQTWSKVQSGTTQAWTDVKQSVHPATDYGYDEKDKFVAKAKRDLAVMDKRIKQLSDKTVNVGDAAKNDAQSKLKELQNKRVDLDKKFDDVKKSSQEDWDKTKTRFKDSFDDLKDSFKRTREWFSEKING